MAPKKKASSPADIPVRDRTWYWSDFTFMPTDVKESPLWMSQALFFAKLNSVPLVDTGRVRSYRKLNRMELDRQVYVNMVDPITPMGGGGKASYFSADFKANPIDIHLDNIVQAKLNKIGFENKIVVNEIDKFAKTQRQKDKDKIIFQRQFRELINKTNEIIGVPPIRESESPYEYVKRLQSNDENKVIDDLSGLIDYIRNQIHDEQDLSLYERYIYKGDIERAFEMGIEHYFINQNKWRVKQDYFYWDLMNFRAAAGTWTIDETTGRGMVVYREPDRMFTSPFVEKNGDDIIYWFYEQDVPFSEFIRRFGTKLTEEQLKEVFLLNKTNGASHGMNWSYEFLNPANSSYNSIRNNAFIRIGEFHIMTQEDNTFAETYVNDMAPSWDRKPVSWTPDTESAVPKRKCYNVWYQCYYVPPVGERLSKNAQADWTWQSRYIFDIQKDIDMYRYGPDLRYARSPLVIWREFGPSYMDIKQAFMPKIHSAWHKFQNYLQNDASGVAIDQDFMIGMLSAVDEANKIDPQNPDVPTGGNAKDAGLEVWKMLKQGGMAWLKFRDKNGNVIPNLNPRDFFVDFDNKLLDKAEKQLGIIFQLYEMLKTALAQNNISEGAEVKPRTPVEGIQVSMQAAREGLWFVEKPARELFIMYGERVVQMILNFRKESAEYQYTKRWDEFSDVVGLAQALMVEGVEDIEPENIGITVEIEDVSTMQEYIFATANELFKNGQLGAEAVGLVIDTAKHNYKYAWALMCLELKRKARELADQAEVEHQRQMELGQQQLQIAIALQGAKSQGKQQEIATQGQIDNMVNLNLNDAKARTMALQKQQLLDNKLVENEQKSNLKDKEETNKANLQQQMPIL